MADNPSVPVHLEDDPTPLVCIIATQLRRAARDGGLAQRMRAMRGVAALRSTVDPQAVTLRFTEGGVAVSRGVAADAEVVISADLMRMSDPSAPKPKVSGAARHPKFALALAKVLEPPTGTWQQEAQAFWAFANTHPGSPAGLRVVALDGGGELNLGATPAEYELHGSSAALVALFSGNTVLGEEILAGNLYAVGSLRYTAELTGRSLAWMMGG